ncbi:MAG TPA: proton-conducting transporter membrane subunit, partial [Fimbriimonadaceae bacterium]|nr:proton-conducting transporter membrane subunit [Fimbriimonadaceae bacterium]
FFKALLFLGAGAVIYAMSHDQDMRNYGNLKKYIPVTFWTMFVAWAAIAGIPFLFAGAYSKEAILGAAVNVSPDGASELLARVAPIAGWVGFGVALLTAGYMTRLMMLTFSGSEERWRSIQPHAHHEEHHEEHAHAHHDDPHGFFYTDADAPPEEHEHHHALDAAHEPKEVPWEMWLPLVVLALGATFLTGYFMERNEVFAHWLYPHLMEAEHAQYGKLILLIVGTAMAVLGTVYAYLLYHAKKLPESEGWDLSKWSAFRRSANRQFEIDESLAGGSVAVGGVVGRVFAWFDTWVVDGIVNLVGVSVRYLAGIGKYVQRGFVRSYALLMVLGVAGILYAVVRMWMQVKGD